jgi:hypothetical protein
LDRYKRPRLTPAQESTGCATPVNQDQPAAGLEHPSPRRRGLPAHLNPHPHTIIARPVKRIARRQTGQRRRGSSARLRSKSKKPPLKPPGLAWPPAARRVCSAATPSAMTGVSLGTEQIIPLNGIPHRRLRPHRRGSPGPPLNAITPGPPPPHRGRLAQQIAPPKSASGKGGVGNFSRKQGARPRAHDAVFWWA